MKCLNESNEADSEFKVGLSIGYATTSTDNQLSNVIREADQKMYAEKAEKKRKLDDIF
jgi:GGDEF domain-containing protein